MILTQIARQVEVVLLIDLMADRQIDIIEGSPAILILRRQILEKPVRIGGPERE